MSRNRRRRDYNPARPYNPGAVRGGEDATTLYYRMYRQILTELAMNRFKWVGLPPEIDVRFIEKTLLTEPMLLFFRDVDPMYAPRFYVTRAAQQGQQNIYENPTKFTTQAVGNFGSRRLTGKNSVPIWCNYQRVPDWYIVDLFAQQLAIASRTVDINLMQQRKPFVISTSQDKVLSVQTALKDVLDGEYAVVGTEELGFDGSTVQAFNTNIHPQLVTQTQLAKEKIWDECMTMLGVNSVGNNKRERLVVDEANANNEQASLARSGAMSARTEAADLINRMFGLSVRVEFNSDVPQSVPSLGDPDMGQSGGEA